MTFTQKIKIIRDALVPLLKDGVYHYWREVKKNRYIIWAETEEDDSFHGGNHKEEQCIRGTIDLFTKTEYDSLIDDIQNALEETDRVSYSLYAVQYEDETGFIHYTWNWEVC